MKQSVTPRKWKRILSAGLSFALAAAMLPPPTSILASAAETAETEGSLEKMPVKDKTPVPDKAGSISMSQLEDNITQKHPFPKGTAGSDVFRIPAMITMENGELLAIADARYTQPTDGNGLDTMAAVSSDGGATWEYSFPFFFPDSYRDSHRQSTAFIDPGLLEGPDGTVYCIADAFPTEYSLQNIGARLGTGYVDIDGEQRLALTDSYEDVGTAPVNENDTRYLYYVDKFQDGYARILKREDHMPTGYAVDEWYNLYSVDENGDYIDNLKQPQINNETHEVLQNVYYKDSKFHVYQTGYLWLVTSKDHGRTWEHPTDIIPQIKKEDDRALLISPGCGLTASDGTLVIGVYYHGKGDSGNAEKASLLYSSDNGVTWNRTEDVDTGSSENEVVELEDGTIRMFYRGGSGRISYADFTKNADGGYDVGAHVDISECSVTSSCNMGAITYSKKINGKQAVLVSCPGGPGRTHGKLFTLLVNEDKTMSLYNVIDVPNSEEAFVYSTLSELPDGSVSILWEERDQTAEIWYDNFDISEFAPGAFIEREDGASIVDTTVAKEETSIIHYESENEGSGDPSITKAPNPSVATVNIEKEQVYTVEFPVYSHVANANSLESAFATATSEPSMLNLADAEFTFTKNNDAWLIQSNLNHQYLALQSGANYFSSNADAVTITGQEDGTIQISKSGNYAGFYKAQMNFNRQGNNTDTNLIYNLSLWEKLPENDTAGNSSDSRIPRYQKVSANQADDLSGRSFLISVEYDGKLLIVYPVGGEHSQTKLLATKASDNESDENTIQAYARAAAANNLDTAFATSTAQMETIQLSKAELKFTKNGDKFQIKNEANNLWMTIAPAATKYFATSAADVVVDAQSDGTVQIHCESSSRGTPGYACFYKGSLYNWNRTGAASDANGIYNLTLWEKNAAAPSDSKIPGYQEATISTTDDISPDKSYLITAKADGHLILLYPGADGSNKEKLIVTDTAVKTYAHTTCASSLADAFSTSSPTVNLVDLTTAEFTFTKTDENYQIFNEANQIYLTFSDGSSGTNYFSDTAQNVTSIRQTDGTVQLKCTYTRDDSDATGYAVFYKGSHYDWNRTGAPDNSGIYNLTLWERNETAPESSLLPCYQEVEIPDTNIENGKRYLITAKIEDNIVLLYPKNGEHNQPKLIATDTGSGDEEDPPVNIPDPSVTIKTKNSISITGVNEGFSTAVIDGRQYRIRVTDDTETKQIGESFDISYLGAYDTSSIPNDMATVTPITGDTILLHERMAGIANSVSSFSKEPNTELSIADAEFTFTEATGDGNEGKWIIKNGDKYLVHKETSSQKLLFDSASAPIAVEQTENAATFRIYNPAGSASNGSRYLMFDTGNMRYDAMGSHSPSNSYLYELSLWKKDASATDSLLPGYKKLTADETIQNNGVYLISCQTEINGTETSIILWPKGPNEFNADSQAAATKLARLDTSLRITPLKNGSASLTIDGQTYKYHFVANAETCQHPQDNQITKGFYEADCETEGSSGDTVCGLCYTVIQESAKTPATNHNWGNPVIKQSLSETTNGISFLYCANSNLHERKIKVYASAYKQLKELAASQPEETLDANKAAYQADDVSALKAAYDAGKTLSEKPAEQQTNKEMYDSIIAQTEAKKQLHRHREGLETNLLWMLDASKPIHDSGKQDVYTQSAWDAFEAAYNAASGVADASQKTYAELETIVTTLKNTRRDLVRQDAKAGLQTLYNTHKDKTKDDYSDQTWSVFTKALQTAKDVLDSEEATVLEIEDTKKNLTDAVEGLLTNAQEQITAPFIHYTAPAAGQYPKAAAITQDEESNHASAVSDWTEEVQTLMRNTPDAAPAITNKEGIWGFSDQLRSGNSKYNVNGTDKSLAITFKLWLNEAPSSQTELIGRGHQFDFQISGGKFVMWMVDNGYPTEELTISAADHIGKWLDIVMLINGNGTQRFYVNGSPSSSRGDSKPVLNSSSSPFTICYNPSETNGSPLTANTGYMADVKFYDCKDVSEGLTLEYGSIVNQLNATDPTAYISADTFTAKTVWSSVNGTNAEEMEPTDKFEADVVYKATTTFTAQSYFRFPNTEDFLTEICQNVTTGASNLTPTATMSDDNKTLTVEVVYTGTEEPPTELETARANLDAAIQKAEDKIEDGQGIYTNESWNAFLAAYEAAKNPTDGNNAAALQKLADDLNRAITEGLTELTLQEAQKALDDAISTADDWYQAGQGSNTETNWNNFLNAYNAAKEHESNLGVAELKKLADDLTAAMEKLSSMTLDEAKDALKDALDEFKDLIDAGQGIYTDKSWKEFTDAYEAAQNSSNLTDPAALVKLANDLRQAKEDLVEITLEEAKDTLNNVIADADKIFKDGQGNNTENSWKRFVAAYNAAKEHADNLGTAELLKLADNLAEAIHALTSATPEEAMEILNDALSKAESVYSDGQGIYTDESWNRFAEAYEAAKHPVDLTDAAALLVLADNLNQARENLKEMTMEEAKDALDSAISNAEDTLNDGQGEYTDESWNAFKDAYEEAKKPTDGLDIAEIIKRAKDLKDAINGLTTTTIEEAKAALNEAIAAAKQIFDLGQANYTSESWNVFKDAYEEAVKPTDGCNAVTLQKRKDDLVNAQKNLKLDSGKVLAAASNAIKNEESAYKKGNTEYTTASWNTYDKAYKALKAEIAKGSNANPELLASLKKNLEIAKSKLTVDTTWKNAKKALTDTLATMKNTYLGGGKGYTPESWAAFKKAYENANAKAKATAGNSKATDLTRLANALKSAKTNLKLQQNVTYTDLNGVHYVITDAAKKTASAEGLPASKKKKFAVKIEDKVKINNIDYTVTEIKAKGFQKFTKITKVTIGKNVTKIGKQAFNGCKGITSLTVKGNVKTFDKQCFNGCKKLKTITFKGKKASTFKSKSLKGTNVRIKVKLAKGMKAKEKTKMKRNLKVNGR